MKKFILNIFLFFCLVAVVDVTVGKSFGCLQSKVAHGRTGSEYYVCKTSNEDIIIMGSSRASHHYIPSVISAGLGMSCYNGGQDGNGIVLQNGRWKMISGRYKPKLIIYDVEKAFDLDINDNTRYIDRLKPFSGDKRVRDYVASLFPVERIKMCSKLYCYNYKFLEILSDCIRRGDDNSGYLPLNGHIRQEIVQHSASRPLSEVVVDEIKLKCLRELVESTQAEGVQLVFVSSPYWGGKNVDLSAVVSIAEEYGVPFLDYTESEICNNPDFFADSMHLNADGALAFTLDLINKLHEIIDI